jgi:hypothetical protein
MPLRIKAFLSQIKVPLFKAQSSSIISKQVSSNEQFYIIGQRRVNRRINNVFQTRLHKQLENPLETDIFLLYFWEAYLQVVFFYFAKLSVRIAEIQNNASSLGGYEGLRDNDVKRLIIIIIFIGSPSLMSSDCTRLIFKVMASCENKSDHEATLDFIPFVSIVWL